MKCKKCSRKVPASKNTGRTSKWNIMQAGKAGWFFQRNGDAYCPEHVPEWVEEWRRSKSEGSVG